MATETQYVVYAVNVGSSSSPSRVYGWGRNELWTAEACNSLHVLQGYDTHAAATKALSEVVTISATNYHVGVTQGSNLENLEIALLPHVPSSEEMAALDEVIAKARKHAYEQATEVGKQDFATKVLEWDGGCESGKQEFLEDIGLGDYASHEKEYDFRITIDGKGDLDEVARELERIIDHATLEDGGSATVAEWNLNDY